MLMLTHEARLIALREELARRGLDGFVVPLSDEHLSEYVGGYAERLAWLTGFGGSAGSAVVLREPRGGKGAAMFVDGRYTLQVRDQVDGRLYDYCSVPQVRPSEWIAAHMRDGARIGFDPWLHTTGWIEATRRAVEQAGGELVAVTDNPLDTVWEDRPAPSAAPAFVQDEALTGRSSADKRAAIADWLAQQGADATVIAALDCVAWTLNVRGRDVDHTPVALSYLIAHRDGTADWYIAPGKVPDEVATALGNAVRVLPRDQFESGLQALAGKTVALDPERAVAGIFEVLDAAGAAIIRRTDPTVLPKAIKTPAEQAGHRAAQARDGAAMTRFLHWLDIAAPNGEVDELRAVARLLAFRQAAGDLADTSFDTISGAGANGAIVHYRAEEDTNRPLAPGSVFLCDSGGQYPDGTTDITRTVWIDTRPFDHAEHNQGPATAPPAEVKDRFTRVLKGHIALAVQSFPPGTPGSALDILARQHLWAAGLDYAHGTGHGVGAFLSVHEGPQRIAKARGGQAGTEQELLAGMILSNEPGYYKTGEYGIRIENLALVVARDIPGAEGEWLGFETLTLAPIDRRLVDRALLSPAEITWWNSYHARVLEVVGPQLAGPQLASTDDAATLAWLEHACLPL